MPKPASEAIPNELLMYERTKRHWTREDVVKEILKLESDAGVDINTVGRWERGITEPSTRHLKLLTTLYERSIEELGYVSEDRIPFWNIEGFSLRNSSFLGRKDYFEKLYAVPMSRDEHQKRYPRKLPLQQFPQALIGLGGIGKTQIALEYAYRYMHSYHTIVWLRADSFQTLHSDFAAIATLLHLPEKEQPNQEQIITAVKEWLKSMTRWLLIFDNVENPEDIYSFIPSSCYGHILVTTRSQFFVPEIGIQPIEVSEMSQEESMDFLLRRAMIIDREALHTKASQSDQTLARSITETLGRLPLALDQAGAYIQKTQCGLSGYYDAYKEEHAKLLYYQGSRIAYPYSVASTWAINFEKIRAANPSAIDLLYLFAFLHPDAIPEALLQTSASTHQTALRTIATNLTSLDLATEELLKYSFVRRNATARTYTIHRLVQTVIKDLMPKDIQKQWAEHSIKAVHHVYPMPEVTTWSRCEQYLPHALACASHIKQWDLGLLEGVELLNRVAYYLWQRAQYAQAGTLCTQALALAERFFGDTQARGSLNTLVEIYYDQGKYAQAQQACQRLLAICESTLGRQHADTAEALHNLGALYHVQGDYVKAEQLYRQALDIKRETLPLPHPAIATSLNTLASVYEDQEDYIQAETHYHQARIIYEQTLPPEHPDVITNLNNLASLYHSQSRYPEAEELLREAMTRQENALGHEHPQMATFLNNLGKLYYKQGRYDEAESLYQEALDIYKSTVGPQHPFVAGTLNNLGNLYRQQEKYDQAEQLYLQALTIIEQALGSDHPTIVSLLEDYASLLDTWVPDEDKTGRVKKRVQRLRNLHQQ